MWLCDQNCKFEIRQRGLFLPPLQSEHCTVSDLADDVSFPFRLCCEKLWVDVCNCPSSQAVSRSARLSLDFHFSFLSCSRWNHMSRQMYREHRRWRAGVNGAVIEIFLFCFQFLFIIDSLTEDYSLCCQRLLIVHKTLSTFAIGFLI